jgi:four helix bundle protein
MGGFSDLIVWREAVLLAARVDEAAGLLPGSARERWGNQIVRAAGSVAANIAEGYGKGVSRDCLRYLRIARASKDELESHLAIIRLRKLLPDPLAQELIGHARRVGFLTYRFAQSVERRL